MNNKKNIIIGSIALALVLLVGSSYALLRNSSRGTNPYVMNVGTLEVSFKSGIQELSLNNAYPISDEEGLALDDELIFTIKNTGNITANYNLYIDEISTNPEFKTVIKYVDKKGEGEYSNIKVLSDDNYIDRNGYIEVGEEITYRVKCWLDYDADSTYMNKVFSARIVVETIQYRDYYYDAMETLESIKNKVAGYEGVYFFDDNGDLDYGDENKINLNLERDIPKGNVSIWNNQVIYACLNYGEINYEYSYNQTKKIRELTKRTMPCLTDRYQNLVINGDLTYKSNLNLEQFGTYVDDQYLSLLINNSYQNRFITDYIPIDMNKTYQFSVDMKTSNLDAKYYIGYAMYDADKNNIDQWNVGYVNNTLTELAEDLNPGDKVVYFNNLSNWNANGIKSFIVWNKVDSTDYEYQPLTYGNYYGALFSTPEQLDKTNNIITLDSAWPTSRGKIPKGTKISQAIASCGAYHYGILSNSSITNDFKTYSNSNVNNSTNSACNKFRSGTKFIKLVIIYNGFGIQNLETDVKNIIIKEVNE